VDKFPVMRGRCGECLFTPERIVSVERMQDILADCRKTGKYFVCHKDPKAQACCYGYYHYQAGLTQNVQVVARLQGRGFDLVEWRDADADADADVRRTEPAVSTAGE
jgi:hypothetical protein